MRSKLLLMIIFIVSALTAHASSLKGDLENAAKEYERNNISGAISGYESIIKEYGASPGVLYNLGNAYTKEKQYGSARICYERALKLDPTNKLIKNNIDYVASRVDIQNRNDLKGEPLNVLPEDPWFFKSLYNMVSVNVASNTWAILGAISFILFVILLADYIYTRQVWVRKVGFFGALCMLGVSILFIIFAICARHEAKAHNAAVIMESKVELLTEPTSKGKEKGTPLNAGTKVDILGTEGGTYEHPEWYNVRLNSDFQGWVRSSAIEII